MKFLYIIGIVFLLTSCTQISYDKNELNKDLNKWTEDLPNNLMCNCSYKLNCTSQKEIIVKPNINIIQPYHRDLRPNTFNIVLQPNIFQQIVDNVADSMNYTKDYYNCVQFSEELVKRLKLKGWLAKTKIVTTNCKHPKFKYNGCEQYKNNHMIVQLGKSNNWRRNIYIEATIGNIIEPIDLIEAYGFKE
jgi:hypothetical protein